jgi:hypothetical protein
MSSYTRFYLKEANLAQIEPLQLSIDKLLDAKGVNKEPIRKWFSTQFIKWFKSNQDDDKKPVRPHTYAQGEPSWMSGEGIVDFTGFEPNDIEYLNHMIDYFNTLEDIDLAKINKEPYGTIVQKIASWDASMTAKSKQAASAPANSFKEGVDYEPIYKTKDSRNREMTWVKLLSKKAYRCEGEEMGHCVGGYDPKTPNQDIISLWDKENRPHVTIEIKKKNIEQIKGNSNQAPAERYQEPSIAFVKNLLKKGYKVTGDGDNIGMAQYESSYYFTDSPEWQQIYTDKIVPMQQKAFEEIKKRIVTVAGEGFDLISSYITGLQKGFRYV